MTRSTFFPYLQESFISNERTEECILGVDQGSGALFTPPPTHHTVDPNTSLRCGKRRVSGMLESILPNVSLSFHSQRPKTRCYQILGITMVSQNRVLSRTLVRWIFYNSSRGTNSQDDLEKSNRLLIKSQSQKVANWELDVGGLDQRSDSIFRIRWSWDGWLRCV